jgi:hypothetical protein
MSFVRRFAAVSDFGQLKDDLSIPFLDIGYPMFKNMI